jgi:type I restriction enzyme S subunit
MGELKPGWTLVKFGDIAECVTDRVDDPRSAGVERYVGLEHLDPDSLAIQRWGSPDDVKSTKLRFKTGDIIFGKRRAYQRKVAVASFDGICSAHAMVLRAQTDRISPEFLPFFMQSDLFMDRAVAVSVGSLSPTINWSTLVGETFFIPSHEEQVRVAACLSTSDLLDSALADIERRLNVVHAALRRKYFHDHGAAYLTLRECVIPSGIQIGPFGSQLHQCDYTSSGVPVVMPSDMVNDRISTASIARIPHEIARRLSLHCLMPGDIVLPRRGELNRRAVVTEAEKGWLCGTGSIRIRLSAQYPTALVSEWLASPEAISWINGNAVGTTMKNLNSQIVGRIPVRLPPPELWHNAANAFETVRSCLRTATMRRTQVAETRRRLLNGVLGE